jgi:hypothetical protein
MTEQQAQPMPVLDQVVTRDAAPAELEKLRADRFNGRVTEDHFHKRGDYLRSVLDGAPTDAPPAPPRAVETMDERFARDYAEFMTAPTPERYSGLPSATVFGDSANAFDARMTHVLARGHIPQHLASPLLESTYRAYGELSTAGKGGVEAKLSSVKRELEALWGDDAKARIERVHDLVAAMVEGDEEIADFFDRAPWFFYTSVHSMEFLDRVASHRASLAARKG